VPTFADRGVSRGQRACPPRPLILLFLDRGPCLYLQIALNLSSRGLVNPVLDPLLLRMSVSAGNRTRELWVCSQELWLQRRSSIMILHKTFRMQYLFLYSSIIHRLSIYLKMRQSSHRNLVLSKARLADKIQNKQTPWSLVRERTIPTEWPPLVGNAPQNRSL
jgi:hypothetical protein